MSRFRLGLQQFATDMKENVSLFKTFVIAVLAFILAVLVAFGVHF